MDKQNVVNNEVIKISNKEASRAIETLLNYVSQSSEFCEEDFNKIKNLSERLEKIREAEKVQANITNF
jgi:hypothetical protein